MRRAKIVATLGPSTNTVEKIEELIRVGLDVARVNMSHGTHEGHRQLIENIRQAAKNTGKEIGVLMDLQGPKIRVDKLSTPLSLKEGEQWVIGRTSDRKKYPQYSQCYIPTVYENLVDDCYDGARIFFDDGLIKAKAVEREGSVYKIKILVGGELKSNKGINLPDCEVSAPAFTEKDREDLFFGLDVDCDYFALSFVRKKEDVLQVRKLLEREKRNIPIVSKIEKPQAIDCIEDIIKVSDVIMVARGDMGVELGNHLVPAVQKKIIALCNKCHCPVITATQMLESMTDNPGPTRAEASDVANAIWDGTDAVMLSGETAAGKYPVETIRTMSAIIFEAEKTPKERPLLRDIDLSNVTAAVMVASSMIAEKVQAKAILAVSESGQSCLMASSFRPSVFLYGITNSRHIIRKMTLYWGVIPFLLKDYDEDNFDFQTHIVDRFKEHFHLTTGDKLVITRGDGRFFSSGASNSVKVEIVKDS